MLQSGTRMISNPAPQTLREIARRPDRGHIGLLVVGLASLLFLIFTVPHLADYPVPVDDEIWILSAAHKLATKGVFGTDLFPGFYRADEVYLFNLPAHHIVLAAAFKLFGTSILTGRLVSVLYGIATLALVYAAGKKLGGFSVAVLALGLSLFLRLSIGIESGLPLQETATTMRYDLAAVPFMLGGFLLLLRPTLPRVALAGAVFSLGTLFQFFAAFMFPVAAVYLLLESAPWRWRLSAIGLLAATAIVVALPYGFYTVANWYEYEGQSSTLENRTDLDNPSFYFDNIEHERKRFPFRWDSFEHAFLERPSAKASVIFGLPVSIAFLAWQAIRRRTSAHRLLALTLAGLPLEFALLESQKIYYYWIGVVPFLCLGLACLLVWALPKLAFVRAGNRPALQRTASLAVGLAAGVFLVAVFFEGAYAQVQRIKVSDSNTSYLAIRDQLEAVVPPGASVLGATSLAWALPDTEYRSYYMLFYRTNPRTTDHRTTISGYLDEIECEYVVFNRTSLWFLQRLIERDKQDLNNYLNSSAEKVLRLENRSYGFIEVWKVDRSRRP